MCVKHYTRVKRYGDASITHRGEAGSGWVNKRDGYRYLSIKGSGRHILEHRMIMETYLGRKLNEWEEIHHINKIKTDNRIENLAVVTLSVHRKLHRKNGTSDTHKWCPKCKALLPRTMFNKSRSNRGGGLSSICKSCNKEHCLNWYNNNGGNEWMKQHSKKG